MPPLPDLASSVLFTDQYQLTMAQLYFRQSLHERRARFDHFFRSYPDYGGHRAGYCINAGMASLVEWLRNARFTDDAVDCLAAQTDRTGGRLFQSDFLEWLRGRHLLAGLTLRAVPEGRVVHPNEPLTVVEGPLALVQILESALLNHLNYQTLVATKAARIKQASAGGLLLDFGLRRAQGPGAVAGTRAALIGGADFSSNVAASHAAGVVPKGTHAHSMVQAFMALGEGELGAFRAYAEAYPDDCLLLVDTVDTLESGVPNAIRVFEELKRQGNAPVGIRLDSGDLADLALRADRLLADAGFPGLSIVLSDGLDEITITRIHGVIRSNASSHGVDPDDLIGRLSYGVGTALMTSAGDAALDGVYKLVAVENERGSLEPVVKISEVPEKIPNPGGDLYRIYRDDGEALADCIALRDEHLAGSSEVELVDPLNADRRRSLGSISSTQVEPLHKIVVDNGAILLEKEALETVRSRRLSDLERLSEGVKRLVDPDLYEVSLSPGVSDLKWNLVRRARESGTSIG